MEDTKPSIPEFAKYSVAVMHVTHADNCDKPDPDWHKSDHLVSKKDMVRVFEGLKKEAGKDIEGMVRFAPQVAQGDVIRVFFNPSDINSLYVVADKEEIANVFFESRGLKIPYPGERVVGRYSRWRF